MLSFNQQPQQSDPVPIVPDGETKPFSFDLGQAQTQNGTGTGGNSMMDLQGMNIPGMDMNDLAALLQQGSQGFSLDAMMGNAAAAPPQQPVPTEPPTAPVGVPAESTNPGLVTNDETEQLLAQLGAFTDGQTDLNLDQAGDTIADDDMDALLASLGGADGQDFANFDFSASLDMANMGEMAGLFNTSTTGDMANAETAVPAAVEAEGQVQAVPIDLTADEPKKADPPLPLPLPASHAEPAQQEQQQQQQQQPESAPPQLPLDDVDFSAINMDDFNFGGEEDGEGGIGMSGDEFESLLASFN